MVSELQPTIDNDLAVLQTAIDSASESTLRYVLKSICLNIPEARERAGWSLLVDATKKREVGQSDVDTEESEVSPSVVSDSSDETDNSDEPDDSGEQRNMEPQPPAQSDPARPKIRVPRYAFCTNCKDEFDVTENKSTSCRYHPDDEPEPTGSDIWVDNEFGVDDSPMWVNGREHCWEFSCCGETLASNPEGCEVDWHREGAPERKVKRVRTWDYQPSF